MRDREREREERERDRQSERDGEGDRERGARAPCQVGPGRNKFKPVCGPRMPIRQGPGGPYAKNPWRSTSIHIYVGPRSPYAKDPKGPTNIHTSMWGPGARKPMGPIR